MVNHSCIADDKCEQGTTLRIECDDDFSTLNILVECLPSHTWNADMICENHIEGTPDEETGFEKAYYNFADRVKLPENAIKVEDLYDILFSPESKETMKNQFKNNKKKGAFIITKTPLKVTKNDFMRMVVEHDVHTIVMMNNMSEMKLKSIGEDEIYWPENEDHTLIQNMTIGKTGEECEGGLRKITLDLNRFGKTRKLQLIQFEGWPDDSALPSSPKDIINLFDAVQYWQHQSGNNPVLVHCMNGADRSGLYCVVSAVLERMRIEQDVAITQVINEMRNYREQIVPSLLNAKLYSTEEE
ncbi:receptor-type tyrosine-protein phosphatase alpha-like [Mya arenaria]|uniref:receptor-type tyrosine-protein phosphatase alpha-like n=1 Tax=Mya arenaria TaxID=6604 RepID=UPI0022DF3CC7|nr:receptor-type tyrosine-protein phosphatase alpha-like [Mya arenaria]